MAFTLSTWQLWRCRRVSLIMVYSDYMLLGIYSLYVWPVSFSFTCGVMYLGIHFVVRLLVRRLPFYHLPKSCMIIAWGILSSWVCSSNTPPPWSMSSLWKILKIGVYTVLTGFLTFVHYWKVKHHLKKPVLNTYRHIWWQNPWNTTNRIVDVLHSIKVK